MNSDSRALVKLIAGAKESRDRFEYINLLIEEASISSVDLAFFGESLLKAIHDRGEKLLSDGPEKRCSFCLKTESQVPALVAAPNANICCECVDIARRAMPRTGVRRWLLGPKWTEELPRKS